MHSLSSLIIAVLSCLVGVVGCCTQRIFQTLHAQNKVEAATQASQQFMSMFPDSVGEMQELMANYERRRAAAAHAEEERQAQAQRRRAGGGEGSDGDGDDEEGNDDDGDESEYTAQRMARRLVTSAMEQLQASGHGGRGREGGGGGGDRGNGDDEEEGEGAEGEEGEAGNDHGVSVRLFATEIDLGSHDVYEDDDDEEEAADDGSEESDGQDAAVAGREEEGDGHEAQAAGEGEAAEDDAADQPSPCHGGQPHPPPLPLARSTNDKGEAASGDDEWDGTLVTQVPSPGP